MIEIKDNVIIYKVPINGDLGLISPYLFIERLSDEIIESFPQIKVNKLFASRMEAFHQIQCNVPKYCSREKILLLGEQIELIANNLFERLEEKIYFARLAG
jgi:hypothetical protein